MMFKLSHGICGCTLEDDIRLPVVCSVGVHILQQVPSNNLAASMFKFGAISNVNILPTAITFFQSLNN